jgi:hypothetical protein
MPSTFILAMVCLCATVPSLAQSGQRPVEGNPSLPNTVPTELSGSINVDGQVTSYRIHLLPINSFPSLPQAVAEQLTQRNCMIPQTYEAHMPENVVHASLERTNSSDWAVLCSTQGAVSLLIFFGSNGAHPSVLATSSATDHLQAHDPTGVLGFNWGIDPASPERIHQAQYGLKKRLPLLDHDALADSTIDHRILYHFYSKSAWTLVEMPD